MTIKNGYQFLGEKGIKMNRGEKQPEVKQVIFIETTQRRGDTEDNLFLRRGKNKRRRETHPEVKISEERNSMYDEKEDQTEKSTHK